jgi:hypothetical protein
MVSQHVSGGPLIARGLVIPILIGHAMNNSVKRVHGFSEVTEVKTHRKSLFLVRFCKIKLYSVSQVDPEAAKKYELIVYATISLLGSR